VDEEVENATGAYSDDAESEGDEIGKFAPTRRSHYLLQFEMFWIASKSPQMAQLCGAFLKYSPLREMN